jgi:hypothetical protein
MTQLARWPPLSVMKDRSGIPSNASQHAADALASTGDTVDLDRTKQITDTAARDSVLSQ